ncbi:class I SAM-dependent methyltransferase [Luteimonas notoginsengisoli]|jgi:SAM-dependent methyltransferase|uniref:Class I SAM-dependent methyltransferase n=1 Tax=Luteimonas notoginsengisoli TaxID=1578200 RepID=A0ABV7UQU3_9GAMM
MAQYQSFPDIAGDSRTADKLKALRMPTLVEKSFLDVGCNEGYFCGFAKFMGAARAVGIDHSPEFIYRAKSRFPDCEFHARTWDFLPEGEYDVILLASALHYAEDQAELIRRLVDKLTPSGVLILELGIVSSPKPEWVKVKRGIDERYFPTMAQLKRTLVDYAWKWMGASVNQDGDPVPRQVVHVSRRRPVAYLLMQPPAYGKTSVASRLFPPANVPIVSGDALIQRVARRELDASRLLQEIVDKDYSPFTIDETVQRIFSKKASPDFVRACIAEAGHGDFALDGFVPVKYHSEVEKQFADAGYMPVTLRWERIASPLMPEDSLNEHVAAYNKSLSDRGAGLIATGEVLPQHAMAGYVDNVHVGQDRLVVRGWALEADGQLPKQLVIGVGAERTFVTVDDVQDRKDVQRHLQLPHAKFGYTIELRLPGVASLVELGKLGFSVTLPSGRPLRIAQKVVESMRGPER